MSGITQANWHLDALDLSEDDDPAGDIMALKATADVIDLTRDRAAVQADLDRLAAREARMADNVGVDGMVGVECELKWKPEHKLMGGHGPSCYTCPHFTADGDNARSAICRIGREQHDLIEELGVTTTLDALDAELVAMVARDIDAAEELAGVALVAA